MKQRKEPASSSATLSSQRRHSGEVAIVLAGLVGAAEDHVVELGPVDARIARDQRPDRERREVVAPDAAERSGVAADRSANVVADIGFGHARPSRAFDALRLLSPYSG